MRRRTRNLLSSIPPAARSAFSSLRLSIKKLRELRGQPPLDIAPVQDEPLRERLQAARERLGAEAAEEFLQDAGDRGSRREDQADGGDN